MITGVVTDDRQALIRLIVRGPAGNEQEVEAMIDTGFDGWLSLPSSIIFPLDLEWRRRGVRFWQTAAKAFLTSTRL
jgi:predicted aspartyl protease